MNYSVNSKTNYQCGGNDEPPEFPMETYEIPAEVVQAIADQMEKKDTPINEDIARTVIFDQEISERSATELRVQLLAMCAEDDKRPIRLMLGSPGGGLYESLAIYDTIKMLPVKTVAICNGKVMSGGILILLACDERVSTPNTTFMMHHGHTTLSGNVLELQEQIAEIASLNNRMLDTIIKRTKIRRDQLDEWLVKDHYLNVEQAIKHGLIDKRIVKLSDLDKEPKNEEHKGNTRPSDGSSDCV